MPKIPFGPTISVVLPETPTDLLEFVNLPLGLCMQKLDKRPGKMPVTLASWRGLLCNRDLPPRADRTSIHVGKDDHVDALEWG